MHAFGVVTLFLFGTSFASADLPLPPARLYHFGRPEILRQNVEANTVPEDAWQKFIMGSETRFGLKPFRRGLYGAEHPGHADYYGDLLLIEGKLPSFMMISVAEECRTPANVAWIHALPEDARFIRWWNQANPTGFSQLEEFKNRCYRPKLDRGVRRFTGRHIYGEQAPEDECESVVTRFLDENAIKTVFDGDWNASWYLRDRGCITGIDGTNEELFEVMATLPGYWDLKLPDGTRRESDNPERGAATLTLFIQVLLELNRARAPSPELFEQLRLGLENSDIYMLKEYGTLVLNAYLEGKSQGDESNFRSAAQSYLNAVTEGHLRTNDDFWGQLYYLKRNLSI